MKSSKNDTWRTQKSVVDGDTVYGSVMAGQSAGLVKKEETCKEIIEDVVGLNK